MWKNSSGHDKNMKATLATHDAVGVVMYDDGKVLNYYATMINVKI